jgi:hypothetical protein
MMPCHLGNMAGDPDAAGERIVAFAPPGKHPKTPFWHAVLAVDKAVFRHANTPDLPGHATVFKAG